MSKSTTRAKPVPPGRKPFLPDTAGKTVKAADNMSGDDLVGMTFNMPREWHREFKARAVLDGHKDMKELLVQCFASYKREQEGK